MSEPSLAPAHLAALRERLRTLDFTVTGVQALLGDRASAALQRNETGAGVLATEGGGPLAVLVRLWLLQRPVPATALEEALPDLVPALADAGIVAVDGEEVRALVDVRPHADSSEDGDRDYWVLSDLTPGLDGRPGAVPADHVLGISPACTSLVQQVVRAPVGSALDLGTGCGVQSLHLAAHADRVVATDVTGRSLALAGLTATLNEIDVDLRDGGFFAPVAGERFDLVVTNPPFVISPPTDTADLLVYRDSGLPGDAAVERIVREVAGFLNPGGWCQVLANWVIPADGAWEERITSWLEPTGLSAWVVQREVLDPAQYVELWLKDSGHHPSTGGDVDDYERRHASWLRWLDDQGVGSIGFGWLNLRRPDAGEPVVRRVEGWHHDVEQPIGPEVAAWHARAVALARLDDHALLEQRLVLAPDVVQETHGPPGAEDPETIVLRQQRWMRRARAVDTVLAGLAGACDGDLTVGQVLEALAQLLEQDPEQVVAAYLPQVRDLVAERYLDLSAASAH
ncbi:MAG: methyltransferase [Nocardioides sp.]|nr:methyltransferase [Nocardioides sp.]